MNCRTWHVLHVILERTIGEQAVLVSGKLKYHVPAGGGGVSVLSWLFAVIKSITIPPPSHPQVKCYRVFFSK